MPTIDLVFDADCPNVENARAQLRRACGRAGVPPRWSEWRSDDPEAPVYTQGFGSPTVLLDGQDVMGAEPSPGERSCRIYPPDGESPRGVPPMAILVAALRTAAAR